MTLSQRSSTIASEKIARLGLEDQVTVELRDYTTSTGKYDKIASIGMYEHVGIDNYPAYFGKINSAAAPTGASSSTTASPAAPSATAARFPPHPPRAAADPQVHLSRRRARPHRPHVQTIEAAGFEVHDVEGLREHYA